MSLSIFAFRASAGGRPWLFRQQGTDDREPRIRRDRWQEPIRGCSELLSARQYVVAHDLRQPLRTIKSYTQKLAERYKGQFDAQADDYLTRTVNAADRMRILIDDLLAFSRVQTQGKPPAPTDCAGAMGGACANLE